jgi:hypothetical protein
MTTYDEARRCPKCKEPGKKEKEVRGPGGVVSHTIYCRNLRCAWNGLVCRVIDVRPDGSIPEPTFREKRFPVVPDRTAAVQAAIDRQVTGELSSGGAEIKP